MVKQVDFAPMQKIPVDAQPAPVIFAGTEILIPPGAEIGVQKQGNLLCGLPFTPVTRREILDAVDHDYLQKTFHDAMESSGFVAFEAPNTALRLSEPLPHTDYMIKARVQDVQVDICHKKTAALGLFSSMTKTKGALSLSVDWQIHDNARPSRIYNMRSTGFAKLDHAKAEGLALLFDDAFEMATHNLAADPDFYDLIILGERPTTRHNAPAQLHSTKGAKRQSDTGGPIKIMP